MQFFTFNLISYGEKRPCQGEYKIGYYFVENLEFITEDGKFNREKFQETCNALFL